MRLRLLLNGVLGLGLALGAACGGNTGSDSTGTGGAGGGTGATSGTGGSGASAGSGGIDCSRVGCAPPPMCEEGCTASCGCCSCGSGEAIPIDGGFLVCTGGCYEVTNTKPCGGLLGSTCGPDEYCDYAGASCGGDDSPGICLKKPAGCDLTACTGVCGCDGNFYCDDCAAHAAGTDNSSSTSCLDGGGPCGVGGVCAPPGAACPPGTIQTQMGCAAGSQLGSCCLPALDPG